MLNHFGKIFLRVDTFVPIESHPGLYATIKADGRSIGQVRYNYDSHYSESDKSLRVSFDVNDINILDPVTSGRLLEDLVVGIMVWPLKDNNHIWMNSFDNSSSKVYMIVHEYEEDNLKMRGINQAIVSILQRLGAKKSDKYNDKWIITASSLKQSLIAEVIRRSS